MPDAELRSVVRANVADGSRSDAAYFVMNALAALVASFGLLQNSSAVVIGAMLTPLSRAHGPDLLDPLHCGSIERWSGGGLQISSA